MSDKKDGEPEPAEEAPALEAEGNAEKDEGSGAGAEGDQKKGEDGKDKLDEEIIEWEKKLKEKLKETEEEMAKIEAMSTQYDETIGSTKSSSANANVENGPDVDKRSIYVGNVEYETSPDELKEFFDVCGTVNRVTIMVNKKTGRPMGYAYVEFKEEASVTNAVLLDKEMFKGRNLKISAKRTNIRGFNYRGRPRFRRRRRRYGYRPRYRSSYGNRRATYRPY
mmetsp:Transcript_12019/g.16788  ORF Transcript_12019/g.16788 Transcript_12019/m.16788 type:complete len:223 (-) Transcript_12019:381-1049(-)